jgi:hypothetical protein
MRFAGALVEAMNGLAQITLSVYTARSESHWKSFDAYTGRPASAIPPESSLKANVSWTAACFKNARAVAQHTDSFPDPLNRTAFKVWR